MIIGVSVGLLALFRVQQAREFSRPYEMQTPDGINYTLRLVETAAGKTDTDCVLIVYLRLENPNTLDVTLHRDWFFLVDHDRKRYRPSTTGTQTELIKLPANGVLDREMLSFTVPGEVFTDRVALEVNRKYRIMIKDEAPFGVRLRPGEFHSFRRRSW